MEVEISPEPSEREREALLRALADPDVAAGGPPAYLSPWRLAGLPDDPDDER